MLGEFGRLLAAVDAAALPPAEADPGGGVRPGRGPGGGGRTRRGRVRSPLPTDDLDDPWGRGDQCFSRVADEIEETVHPLAAALLP